MKRRVFFLSIVLLFLVTARTDAFIQGRQQWWKSRVHQLQEKKSELLGKRNGDHGLIGLVDRDLGRARDVLTVFEKGLIGDGSLSCEPKKYTRDEIVKEVGQRVPALVAVQYLHALTAESGDWNNVDAAKAAADSRLKAAIRARFSVDGSSIAGSILRENIDAAEWKNISTEFYVGKMILSRDEITGKIMEQVAGMVYGTMQDENCLFTPARLAECINSHANTALKAGVGPRLGHEDGALELSWTWKKAFARIEAEFDNYAFIISSMGGAAGIDLEKVRFYHKNPLVFEKDLFSRTRPTHEFLGTAGTGKAFRAGEGQALLIIPGYTGGREILDELDSLRKKAVMSLRGREGDDFFRLLRKQSAGIIGARMASAGRLFRHEADRAKKMREDSPDRPPEIVNLGEFEKAEKLYRRNLGRARSYRKETVDFITWLSRSMTVRSETTADTCRAQFELEKRVADFVVDLFRDGLDASGAENREINVLFSSSAARIGNIFDYLKNSLSLRDSEKSSLSARDLGELTPQRADFQKMLASSRKQVQSLCVEFSKNRSRRSVEVRGASDTLRDRIAQNETDAIRRSAEEYAQLFGGYSYPDDLFAEFAIKYAALEKQAAAGDATPELDRVIKSMSVLASLESYNPARLKGEIEGKRIAREETRTAVSRLSSLLDFYRRRGVGIQDRPGSDDTGPLMKRIGAMSEVRFSRWAMNEGNYESMDRRAAMNLKRILSRSIWEKTPAHNGENAFEVVRVDFGGGTVSMQIPHGWTDARSGDDREGVRSFNSMDNLTRIIITRMPAGEGNEPDISGKWLRDRGSARVKERWGRTGGKEFYWVLSRDRDSSVRETFTFTKNGAALIISGVSRKDLYGRFRSKLQSVIDSISF